MTTFDGWEAQLYGPDTLAHFRTKGSKNGVRRYQNEDGTWTPLGLKERKAREGWGESKEAKAKRLRAKADRLRSGLQIDIDTRYNHPDLPSYLYPRYDRVIKSETKLVAKAEKKAVRAEKRAANAAARKERLNAYMEERRKNDPKNLTEDELRKRIEHIKLEQEYKELTRSPALKIGMSAVKAYLKYKENKAAAEKDRREQMQRDRQLAINETNAKAALIKAKAEKKAATDRIIDNLTGGAQRKNARAAVLKAKTERSKNTIRGAISSSLGNIIRKSGARTVSGMSDTSLASRGKAKVKSLFEKISNKSNEQIDDMAKRMRKERNKDNPLKG